MTRSISARINGRVQGVGFRYSACRVALGLGLRGWVKNEPDGSVSTRCEGDKEQVEQYLQWLHQGPAHSSVHSVQIQDMPFDNRLGSFEVLF